MRGKKKKLDTIEEKLNFKKVTNKQRLQEKGITIIALVVTIVILLILAGVTLNIALSNNGLFSKAKKAADEYNQKSLEEELQILFAEKQMENIENKSKGKADITELLEEKIGEGKITKEDIEEFNEKLQQYGYEEEIKTISSAEEIAKIGKEGDDSLPLDGIYVQLEDIDSITAPIGTESTPFTGVFNGNGKKITSLTITAEEDVGMFGVSEGTIKNVTVESCTISSSKGRVGAIAGRNRGVIENCKVLDGTVDANGGITIKDEGGERIESRVGGICGENYNNGVIKSCTNSADITGTYLGVGGICGIEMKGLIDDCVNNGKIEGDTRVGGIMGQCGYSNEKGEVVGCSNHGKVIGKTKLVGGICGDGVFCNIGYSKNLGNVSAIGDSGYFGVGGIVGNCGNEYESSTIKCCFNEGDVSLNLTVGLNHQCAGIVGSSRLYEWSTTKLEIIDCYNAGHITITSGLDTGVSYPGGIIGWGRKTSVTNCYNKGEITSSDGSKSCGGIISSGVDNTFYNNYWLDSCGAEFGVRYSSSNEGANSKNSNELKDLADTLGKAYEKNDTINGGYPYLKDLKY